MRLLVARLLGTPLVILLGLLIARGFLLNDITSIVVSIVAAVLGVTIVSLVSIELDRRPPR